MSDQDDNATHYHCPVCGGPSDETGVPCTDDDVPTATEDMPLCAGHAAWWFTGRNHLATDTCVVCAFTGASALERDAARYRWLRANGAPRFLHYAELDAAIDAAMRPDEASAPISRDA
jgi:hypothetical protein